MDNIIYIIGNLFGLIGGYIAKLIFISFIPFVVLYNRKSQIKDYSLFILCFINGIIFFCLEMVSYNMNMALAMLESTLLSIIIFIFFRKHKTMDNVVLNITSILLFLITLLVQDSLFIAIIGIISALTVLKNINEEKSIEAIVFYMMVAIMVYCSSSIIIVKNLQFNILSLVITILVIILIHFLIFKSNKNNSFATADLEKSKEQKKQDISKKELIDQKSSINGSDSSLSIKENNRIDENDTIYKKRTKFVDKINYKITTIIFICTTFVSIAFGIFYYSNLSDQIALLENNNYNNQKLIEEYEKNIKSLNNNIDVYKRKLDKAEEKVDFYDKNIAFVVEGYENYYYSYECIMRLKGSNASFLAYNTELAKAKGYKYGACPFK